MQLTPKKVITLYDSNSKSDYIYKELTNE